MYTTIQNVGKAVSRFHAIRQVGKDWPDDQYGHFYRLYVTENLPLPEVIQTLEKEHGFMVTPKQCKSKIKEKGLKKYLKSSEMDMVVELQRKRNLGDDQNTGIQFGGLKIQSERIERYKKRRAKRENEIQSATAGPHIGVSVPPLQETPTELRPPGGATIESANATSMVTDNISENSTAHGDLGSLLKRLCKLESPEEITHVLDAPRSDGTIDIKQMTLMKKPEQHELEVLRSEWEKQRELAWHHLSKGRLQDAEYHARVTLATQESCLGVRNISTMGTINILSYIHGSQTESSEVETYEWMQRACLDIYGRHHHATLDSMRDLAWVYQAAHMETKAQGLLRDILEDLISTPPEVVADISTHFIEMSRATTDFAVLLCLQGKMDECDNLLGALWSAVAFFTLKHKCSLRVAAAMGRKLAGMGKRDDTAFLLTVIVQNAVTDTGSSWSSYRDITSHRIVAGRGTVGELLEAYKKHVLPLLAKTMAILRKYMGFGRALCEPVTREDIIKGLTRDEPHGGLHEDDLQSFNQGEKLIK